MKNLDFLLYVIISSNICTELLDTAVITEIPAGICLIYAANPLDRHFEMTSSLGTANLSGYPTTLLFCAIHCCPGRLLELPHRLSSPPNFFSQTAGILLSTTPGPIPLLKRHAPSL
jgi:hypothetical protein